jgi:hypothetical protein
MIPAVSERRISSGGSVLRKGSHALKVWVARGAGLWNQLWDPSFFFINFQLPLVAIVFYFVSFAVLHAYILSIPVGVNYTFATRSWKYLSLLTAGSVFILYAIVRIRKGSRLEINIPAGKLSRSDLLLLLFPLTPVAQYILHNQDILSASGSLLVLAIFALFSSMYVFAIPALLAFAGSTRTWVSLGLAFTFAITSMAALSRSYAWYESGSLVIQWILLGGVFLAIWLLFDLNDRWVLRLLISVVFITNSVTQLLSLDDRTGEPQPQAEHRLLTLIDGRTPLTTPSIYLLVYDAYVSNETMLGYGIDNSAQEEYLSELGFQHYPHTYSVNNFSIGTMSKVLNAATDSYGNPRKGVSGDGIVQNALRSFGYRMYGLFPNDYYFLEIDPAYDYSVPGRPSSPGILARAIFMGEFMFDIGYNKLPREQFVAAKQKVFSRVSADPLFVYTHSDLPGHTQNSGACRPEETDLYAARLANANAEMRQDLATILANDPGAIIIVAGDHGPHLTKNCSSIEEGYAASEISRLDIQDRFGTFLAIRWPAGGDADNYDDITVLQDLFPAVFAYLFADERLLESKIVPITNSTIVRVENGFIVGGMHDGQPLFLAEK